MSIKVSPYLNFNGNCNLAVNFYKEALQAELKVMTFGEMPGSEFSDDLKTRIMHASLEFGQAVIMASDTMPGQDVTFGNSNSVMLSVSDVIEAERIFNALSVGGNVVMPFGDAVWGAKYCMFTYKFGVNWIVNCEQSQS